MLMEQIIMVNLLNFSEKKTKNNNNTTININDILLIIDNFSFNFKMFIFN